MLMNERASVETRRSKSSVSLAHPVVIIEKESSIWRTQLLYGNVCLELKKNDVDREISRMQMDNIVRYLLDISQKRL